MEEKIFKFRDKIEKEFYSNIERQNTLWYEVFKILITLSSSFLLITLAITEKLFNIKSFSDLPIFLVISWVLFSISIIFSIFTLLNEVAFISKNSHIREEILQHIDNGTIETYIKNHNSGEYLKRNDLILGIFAINAFILAIFFLCFVFLKNIMTLNSIIIITIFVLAVVSILNIHLYRKSYNNKTQR